MKRTLALVFVVSAAVVGLVLAWYAVRQDREFRRLIALGDASLAREQTYVAIEAFSGALALRPDSMVAHLKRGDTYRRRGELSAALRDLRDASGLDPSPDVAASCGSDGVAFSTRGLSSAAFSGLSCERSGESPDLYLRAREAATRSSVSTSAKSASSALVSSAYFASILARRA